MACPERVLIADDDPMTREMLSKCFSEIGSRVVDTAQDGFEAKQILLRGSLPYNLLVLDLSMPNEDGFALLNFIEVHSHRTQILIVSGMPEHVVELAAKLTTAKGLDLVGCLGKPIDLAKLSAMIASHEPAVQTDTT